VIDRPYAKALTAKIVAPQLGLRTSLLGLFLFASLPLCPRRFPPPWTVEQIPGVYKVRDANSQSLGYVSGRETRADADIANILSVDEARRIASNISKLPSFLIANSDGAEHD
jgi:hypothetical protein